MKKRWLSLLLVFTLIFNFLPSTLIHAELPEPKEDFPTRMENFAYWYENVVNLMMIEGFPDIIRESDSLFQQEEVVLNLNKSVQIVGDIHGDLNSLREVLDLFFREVLDNPEFSILFLGDYIDRGSNSFVCMMILLKLKTVFPNNVYLLRGNHEDDYARKINWVYGNKTLYDECKSSCGETSQSVYEAFCHIFNNLSIAAVVLNSFFCVHGGIPHYVGDSFKDLSELKKPIFVNDSPLVKQFLWNDPMHVSSSDGFNSSHRGEGILLFGEGPVSDFCRAYNFSMIIRGHEVCKDGFNSSFGNKVLTIFSSANYPEKKVSYGGFVLIKKTVEDSSPQITFFYFNDKDVCWTNAVNVCNAE